jgi:starvation-inducible DNA-binding protein
VSIVAKQSGPDTVLRPGSPAPMRKEAALISSLRMAISDGVILSFMAQGFHWNVKGPDFPQLHEMFGDIYEDVYGAIDPTAENIRKLGGEAPFLLGEFQRMGSIDQMGTPIDAPGMVRALQMANAQMIRTLRDTFAIANTVNEQGIADFIAGRLDMQQKWDWMLRETAGMGI